MSRRRRRDRISNINVVPYLDVLLVLLVIFMITTPLFSQGVIDVPSVGETPAPSAEEAGLVVLYEQGAASPYRLVDYKDGGNETGQLTLDELISELAKKGVLNEEYSVESKPYIILSVDKERAYKDVVELLGKLRDAGFDNLGLEVENPGQ